MPALEVVSGFTTAPGVAAYAAITVCNGNSLTVRNAANNSEISLLSAWQTHQAAGASRIRSPKMHDNVVGLLAFSGIAQGRIFLHPEFKQKLYAQDELTVEMIGSAVAGDLELVSLLLYYADLPGANGNFDTWDSIKGRIKNFLSIENTLTLGATGQYTGEEAINAEFDLLRANTNYAILGTTYKSTCNTIRYRGIDFANMGVGVPVSNDNPYLSAYWFKHLSEMSGLPTIPIFNSANKDGLLIDGQQNEDAAAVTCSTILAEL